MTTKPRSFSRLCFKKVKDCFEECFQHLSVVIFPTWTMLVASSQFVRVVGLPCNEFKNRNSDKMSQLPTTIFTCKNAQLRLMRGEFIMHIQGWNIEAYFATQAKRMSWF